MTLDGALPLCPLWQVPEALTVGHARRGDVVLLRFTGEMTPQGMERARVFLQPFTERTGVEFLLLDKDVEVVSSTPKDES